jgi:glyoxylase-like metal-dependent hydrolase (beta-lactamase superfamily II)
MRAAGRSLGDELRGAAKVRGVKTLPASTLPYPTRFAFNGVVPLPWPMITMVHRTLLVQLDTEDGRKNLLFNPTDTEAARATPFFSKLAERVNRVAPFAEKLLQKKYPTLEEQLAAIRIRPEEIDVIAYDHFHTQDLRGVMGTHGQPGRFPNAILLAPEREWNDWDGLHPMQRAWFISDGKKGVDPEHVVTTSSDIVLGDNCLLIQTPGHTTGNQTLFVHAEEGIFGCCENGTSCDSWSPRQSRIPGLARFAEYYDLEVVLNANTPELGGEQYASMLLEKSIVDPAPENHDFVQMFPSSETTYSPLAPGIRPSMEYEHRNSGVFA